MNNKAMAAILLIKHQYKAIL